MDEAAKKHALRLVPYGLYLAGARHGDGRMSVSMVSWFTQTSFKPPLVVLGMHREGSAYGAVQETGVLALNLLGAGQKDLLKKFHKHVDVKNGRAAGLEVATAPTTDCPILPDLPAALELRKIAELQGGDHAAVLFEVVEAHIHDPKAAALDHTAAGLHYAG